MNHLEPIKAAVKAAEFDALLITSPSNRRYATGFPSTAGMALVTGEDAWFFVDSRYIEAAGKAITGAHVEMTDNQNTYVVKLNALFAELGVKTLGVEDAAMSHAEYLDYEQQLKVKLLPGQKLLSELRQSKTEDEIERLIKAQRIAETALAEVLPLIRPGVTEKEIAAELTYRMLRHGAENNSFDPIVVTGVKSSMPHGVPGDVKVEAGSFVTMDFGCIWDGYCSDMTRTVAVGHVTDEMKKVYETVLAAQLAGIAVAKAGVPGKEIDGAARDYIAKAGYGDYFGHGFGHSLGLDIHENPNANPTNPNPMPLNAVCSAEPGIYLPGRFGVRIEDVMILREDHAEVITKAPKELIVL